MVIETVDDIINDSVTTIPQDALIDGGADTLPAPKIFKDTCHIDWNKGAESIYNLIRACRPTLPHGAVSRKTAKNIP